MLEGEIAEDEIPDIITFLDDPSQESTTKYYQEITRHSLRMILPKGFFNSKGVESKLRKILPVVLKKEGVGMPRSVSFFSLSHYRENAFKFFFEMISRWLMPSEKINVILIYAVDFQMPKVGQEIYTLCEVMIRAEDEAYLAMIQKAFPIIETELLLGLESKLMAHKILEVKGLSNDDKTALLQQAFSALIRRMPKVFDQDIITEMQHILLIAKEEFKKDRKFKHLSRMTVTQYVFRKELLQHIKEHGRKRKALVKFFRIPLNGKERIGLSVGLNFLSEKEIFEERQLTLSLLHHFPHVKVVPGSILVNRRGTEPLTTVYIELEKAHGSKFTLEELNLLKNELPKDLISHVEHLMHPIFMPRNEEEIMRNILTLSQQLKYARDLPQVFINFDQQSRANLFFTVIFVEVQREDSVSLQDKFKGNGNFLKYIHDRTKTVGMIRNKHPKRATVFRVKFRKEDFLRLDHSLDLYKARQAVVNELTHLLGEFRDFNGGMISKQNELFLRVKEDLHEEKVRHSSLMLENYFYSLTPVIMQTILEPEALKTLFKMLIEALKKGMAASTKVISKTKSDKNFVFVLFLAHDRSVTDELDRQVNRFRHTSTDLASIDISHSDVIAIGYIFRSTDERKREAFSLAVQHAMEVVLP